MSVATSSWRKRPVQSHRSRRYTRAVGTDAPVRGVGSASGFDKRCGPAAPGCGATAAGIAAASFPICGYAIAPRSKCPQGGGGSQIIQESPSRDSPGASTIGIHYRPILLHATEAIKRRGCGLFRNERHHAMGRPAGVQTHLQAAASTNSVRNMAVAGRTNDPDEALSG